MCDLYCEYVHKYITIKFVAMLVATTDESGIIQTLIVGKLLTKHLISFYMKPVGLSQV